MIEWLPVLVFCLGGECRFVYDETKTKTETECQRRLDVHEKTLESKGITNIISTCIPIKLIST